MKLVLHSIFFVFIKATTAGEAMIVVHEAQLLKEPRVDAKVVQSVRKGQHIYIHKKHFLNSPLDSRYFKEHYPDLIKYEEDEHPGYYLTRDNTGEDAYLPKEYAKLIYRDGREITQSVTPFKPDPFDYRLPEPLPEGYPVLRENSYRSAISLFAGPDLKSNYPYTSVMEKEKFSQRGGLQLNYLTRANWDTQDRVYWGGTFHIWASTAEYDLFDGTNSTENKGQVGFGPVFSYDTWKTEDYMINLLLQVTFDYNRVLIKREDRGDELKEERSFTGFTVSPKIGTSFHFINVFESGSFFIGADMQLILPTTLTSNTEPNAPDLWNQYGTSEDTLAYPLTAIWNGMIGFQFQY